MLTGKLGQSFPCMSGLDDVRASCRRGPEDAGQEASSVTLVAVSKTFGPEVIGPVIAAGQRVFEENRVQEAKGKWPALKARHPRSQAASGRTASDQQGRRCGGVRCHRDDRPREAGAGSGQGDGTPATPPRLFIQVNTGEEPQKSGVSVADADGLVGLCRSDLGLAIEGLMCVPPIDDEPALHFALLRKIAERNGLNALSMGMSGDFETAIALEATHVRVGSAIFGSRPRAPMA